jgi:hypothetical protein
MDSDNNSPYIEGGNTEPHENTFIYLIPYIIAAVIITFTILVIILIYNAVAKKPQNPMPQQNVMPQQTQTTPTQANCNKFIGCYKDKDDRALKSQIGGFYTVQGCYNAVKAADPNAKYYGLQYKEGSNGGNLGECWYGSSNYDIHGTADTCEQGADGIMGKSLTNAVYDALCPWK